ncbi:MAG: zeta toxin family protein [Candidatus Kapabacteria bacterium]|jgi:predicted ABC-type ATPase|nr:zeta toxin family protein [Candidatus Kapabacteria bacterium]
MAHQSDEESKNLQKPLLVLVGGANGSGKTTLARQIAELNNLPFVNADETARNINPHNVHEARFQAGREVLQEVERLREQKTSFVYESTLAGLSLRKILERFKSDGYEISLVYVYLDSAEICIERIKSRVAMGGHFVPDDEVRRRYDRSKQNFLNVYKPLADRWHLYRNPIEGIELIANGHKDGYTSGTNFWENEKAKIFFGILEEDK